MTTTIVFLDLDELTNSRACDGEGRNEILSEGHCRVEIGWLPNQNWETFSQFLFKQRCNASEEYYKRLPLGCRWPEPCTDVEFSGFSLHVLSLLKHGRCSGRFLH